MNLNQLETRLDEHGLFVMGTFAEDNVTRFLIGAGSGMWPIFRNSPEFKSHIQDPLDTWSKRLLVEIAKDFGAGAEFPSDGPPYLPFIAWAKSSGQFWDSPTGMMIHHDAGLMISIRGALRFDQPMTVPKPDLTSPCASCDTRPCESACPVGALSSTAQYDVPRCKSHLETPAGKDCLTGGCLVRRICPVSQKFDRDPDQSGFHMRAFAGGT